MCVLTFGLPRAPEVLFTSLRYLCLIAVTTIMIVLHRLKNMASEHSGFFSQGWQNVLTGLFFPVALSECV